jgi:hypothetical protein
MRILFASIGLLFFPIILLLLNPFLGISVNSVLFYILLSFGLVVFLYQQKNLKNLLKYINNKIPFIKNGWNGKYKLYVIFWFYGIALSIFVTSMLYFRDPYFKNYSFFLYALIFFLMEIWWAVSCWRSSKKSKQIWMYLTRTFIIIQFLNQFSKGFFNKNLIDFFI